MPDLAGGREGDFLPNLYVFKVPNLNYKSSYSIHLKLLSIPVLQNIV